MLCGAPTKFSFSLSHRHCSLQLTVHCSRSFSRWVLLVYACALSILQRLYSPRECHESKTLCKTSNWSNNMLWWNPTTSDVFLSCAATLFSVRTFFKLWKHNFFNLLIRNNSKQTMSDEKENVIRYNLHLYEYLRDRCVIIIREHKRTSATAIQEN